MKSATCLPSTCFSSIGRSGLLPKPGTVPPDHERGRQRKHEAGEGDGAVAPAVPEGAVQARGEEREQEGGEAAQELRGGDGAARVLRVRVDDVRRQRHAGELAAEHIDEDTRVHRDPVGPVLRRPAVDEQPGRRDDRAGERQRDPELGPVLAVARARPQPAVQGVHEPAAELGPGQLAERAGDVVEAADRERLVVAGAPEVREAREHDVQRAVAEGRDDGRDLDERVEGQQSKRPRQRSDGDAECRLPGDLFFILGVISRIAGLLAEPSGSPLED
ncbi:putative efflux pump antibiotic resistance protein [Rosellinia necatrix]|uniref:Putative efflux pump antibiotic resistance protein n=1 Tax=Rosellinia necatrix TaxID=77044 RepID=A0A1S8A5Q7_ROSNE|nr:putative efflux pump antibiotic resistance protein [Rosellinia necatrix]